MSVQLDLWNDTGYTESGIERPPIGATLPAPDFTFNVLNPNKNDYFSKFQVKEDYPDLMNVSYLKATYSFGESNIVIYGWVDSVELVSATEGYPNTNIYWHIDYWRTYNQRAEYKAGTVKRRPTSSDIPPQPYPFRYRTQGTVRTLVPQENGPAGSPLWWFYVVTTTEYDGGNTVGVDVLCFPGEADGDVVISDGNRSGETPGVIYGIDGFLDECLGLTPSRIAGCYMSPVPPVSYTGAGTAASPFRLDGNGWVVHTHTSNNETYATYVCQNAYVRDQPFQQFTSRLTTIKSTDTQTLVVTDMDLNPVAVMPWGIEINNYAYRMIVSVSGAYIEIRFGYEKSTVEGTCVRIPCIPISNIENSWSEYMYSGQRTYDIETRNLKSKEALSGSLTGSLSSALSMVGLGATFGGVKGKNMTAGAAASGGGDILGGLLGYQAQTGSGGISEYVGLGKYTIAGQVAKHYGLTDLNKQEQSWEDYAAAKQSDAVILPGAGWDTVRFGREISLVTLVNDTYSTTQRNVDIQMYGAHVTEPKTSCQSLVTAGGPLRIVGMTIGGDIPVEAKEFIRTMFDNGVRLV